MAENDNSYRDDGCTGSVLNELHSDNKNLQNIGIEILPVHIEGTVHAKRIKGRYRTIKWFAASFWISLFVLPYLRWDGHQAILFDLANRQFHIFGLTVLPQDIWLLAMILLFFALLLSVSTIIAGRLWCGYFCFHTVWVDVFTWIEEKFEGQPNKRVRLDKTPLTIEKIKIKLPKLVVWTAIGFMTAFSFVAYFTDVYDLWMRLFEWEWNATEMGIILGLGAATVFFAGFLREQTCIGFCPYARIQGAMYDTQTVVPTYDQDRGEPRSRLHRQEPGVEVENLGDCIDCNLCVAVCPTGVDIRRGQQFGCITCGLCIDACDSVMDKLKRPRGLIRYASLAEFAGQKLPPFFRRPRVMIYSALMFFAALMLIWGMFSMSPIDVKALHERSPLFVKMSDGNIQNKWTIKVVNKSNHEMAATITVEGHDYLTYKTDKTVLMVKPGNVSSTRLFVQIPKAKLMGTRTPITIYVQDQNNPAINSVYESVFLGPKKP